ncbi:hypothetical protein C923_03415 [Plasmodium falciparum UGT5.1]|uniref:Uncharacterized protein n=1 Tax=Plasmodium falciparum UGT5.1 TaxID=1237627 RepID=W7JWM0_PLAFA|nr:hypothetical protein C923_03415 [Plasmodium falciparum UGT5.1]
MENNKDNEKKGLETKNETIIEKENKEVEEEKEKEFEESEYNQSIYNENDDIIDNKKTQNVHLENNEDDNVENQCEVYIHEHSIEEYDNKDDITGEEKRDSLKKSPLQSEDINSNDSVYKREENMSAEKKKDEENDDKNIKNNKRKMSEEMITMKSTKKLKNGESNKNDDEISYDYFDKNIDLEIYMNKIKNNFNLYLEECEYQLKDLKNCYIENDKLIKEIVNENNSTMIGNNENIDDEFETDKIKNGTKKTTKTKENGEHVEDMEEIRKKNELKIEKKRTILNNIMNIRLIYRTVEIYLFSMRQFIYLLKEKNNFISHILDEQIIIKNNYEQVIENLLEFEADNYEDIKHIVENKILSINDMLLKNNEYDEKLKEYMSYLCTLQCLQEEISQRIDAKTDLRLLMIKKKEISDKFTKQNQRKDTSFNKLSLFKNSIQCIVDKYNSFDKELTHYLSSFYYKIMNHQIDLSINNMSILNNKMQFNFFFHFKEQSNINDVFQFMKYDVITKDRNNDQNFSNRNDVHNEYISIKFYTKDNFDVSILPDVSYLNHFNIQIDISYLCKMDCLVAKANSIDYLRLYNNDCRLLSDIYSNEDHLLLFSNNANDFLNFKYGFPYFWINALVEKPYSLSEKNELPKKEEGSTKKAENKNMDRKSLSEIYNWHLNRTLDISVVFSKVFTRVLFRIWDIWQIRHYRNYPNVFPPFTCEKHMDTLKKIQSVSLQQISTFNIITEESYLKEEKEINNECSKDNIYACCHIELSTPYLVKAYINVPCNGKEPYFSVFLTKKKYSRRLKKLQDYLNTAVVNKHSKVDDTQRQIILTLQLAKLREGAYKYYKSFSKNSSSIFDEEIN